MIQKINEFDILEVTFGEYPNRKLENVDVECLEKTGRQFTLKEDGKCKT